MNRYRCIYPRITFLAIAALFLYIAVNFELYSEQDNGAESIEWRISPFYESVKTSNNNQGMSSMEVKLTVTPLSKTTYLQIGRNSSYAKYIPLIGKIYVKEYSVDDTGKRQIESSSTVDRIDVASDYYSPLLHRNGTSLSVGVFSHFGAYSIK